MEKKLNANIINPMLIMGVCSRGPYRYAKDILQNSDVKWMSWGYSSDYIHPDVFNCIKDKIIKSETEVVFAIWDIGVEKKAKLVRKGTIDHVVFKKEYVNFTIFLKEMVSGFIEFPKTDHYLCRYANLTEVIAKNG